MLAQLPILLNLTHSNVQMFHLNFVHRLKYKSSSLRLFQPGGPTDRESILSPSPLTDNKRRIQLSKYRNSIIHTMENVQKKNFTHNARLSTAFKLRPQNFFALKHKFFFSILFVEHIV